jgi:phage shock protein A
VVEANLFNRLGRVIGSYANSLVSAAEDPEKILDQTVIEMQEDLVKMRQASA